MPDRAIVELYLRLKLLATFVHELGHHQDFSTRVARGRWRADDTEEVEIHAEAIEHAWTRDHVVPYLEDSYPAQVDELRRWLVRHGGIALPLEVLAGDPRTTRGVDGERLFFSVDSARARGSSSRTGTASSATSRRYARRQAPHCSDARSAP